MSRTAGWILVAGQKVALGQEHRHQDVTAHVSDTTLVVHRTTAQPVRSVTGQRPRASNTPAVSAESEL
ncbi:hypothetical protein ACW14X_24020 [Nocardioides sp. YJ-D4]